MELHGTDADLMGLYQGGYEHFSLILRGWTRREWMEKEDQGVTCQWCQVNVLTGDMTRPRFVWPANPTRPSNELSETLVYTVNVRWAVSWDWRFNRWRWHNRVVSRVKTTIPGLRRCSYMYKSTWTWMRLSLNCHLSVIEVKFDRATSIGRPTPRLLIKGH